MTRRPVPVAIVVAALMLIAGILVAVWIFGDKPVGPTLEEEKPRIEAWIAHKGLNYVGDPKDMVYPGGSPLFDEANGEARDRYEYIRSNHRDRPWNDIDPAWLTEFATGEEALFRQWAQKQGLNQYGDSGDMMYAGGTPLFDERTGKSIPLASYVLVKYPLRPWNRQ